MGARAVNGNGGSINVIICDEAITNQPIAEVGFVSEGRFGILLLHVLYLWPIKVHGFYLVDKVRDKRYDRRKDYFTKVLPLKDKTCQHKTR